jgi:hypothetical protein
MSESAFVTSVEALRDLKAAFARFGVDAQNALCTAELTIRRFLDQLRDQLQYWLREVRDRREEVGRARAALEHRRALLQGQQSGCSEQEMALHEAKRHLREAEEKVETVRRWQRVLPDFIKEYEGPARQLTGTLEGDFRHALAILEGRIAALESYAAPAPTPSATPAKEPP